MHSGFFRSNICFATRRQDAFFSRKRVETQRNYDAKTIKISWNRFHIRSEIVQGTLWRRSGASWGAQGVPDWILGVKSWFPWTPRWGPLFDFFSMQNSSDFLVVFWMHFGRILHPFWTPKCIQHGVRNGKCVFLVLSVSCRRKLNLGGFGTPKSIKMTPGNR